MVLFNGAVLQQACFFLIYIYFVTYKYLAVKLVVPGPREVANAPYSPTGKRKHPPKHNIIINVILLLQLYVRAKPLM